MPNMLDAVFALERINDWVVQNHPDRLPFLRSRAEGETIQRIEAKFGRPLPYDLRRLYAAHDGQPSGSPALYLNQRWLPLDLVIIAWEDLCLRDREKGSRYSGHQFGDKAWSADWLPLFGSPRGDHYCVDCGPNPGQYGRIIWFLYDQAERPLIAPSIGDLLSRVALGLMQGDWSLDDGYDGFSD